MPPGRSRRAWGLALLAAVAAGGALAVAPAHATGGAAAPAGADASPPSSAQAGSAPRTGTLLNNQWIITASRCFADDPARLAAGAPKLKTTAVIGRTDPTGSAGQVRQVVNPVPRPERDVVVARSDSPVRSTGRPHLAGTAPQPVSQSLKGAGHGRTAGTWVPDEPFTPRGSVRSRTATSPPPPGSGTVPPWATGCVRPPVVRRTSADGSDWEPRGQVRGRVPGPRRWWRVGRADGGARVTGA